MLDNESQLWVVSQFEIEIAEVDVAASLIARGFDLSGRWELDTASRARFIGEAPKERGVYAFAVDGNVCYVGSTQHIAKRLRRYESTDIRRKEFRGTRRTAFPVMGLIIKALKGGSEVEVLTIVPGSMRRKGLPVDLSAGIEKGLIRELRPECNRRE